MLILLRIREIRVRGDDASSRTEDKETAVTANPEFGNVTGTKDKDYDIIWFTETCLSNVLRLETYIEDAALAGDDELAEFFRRAQHESRKGAEEGKKLLAKRLKEAGA
jgi:hypothetical protein